MTYAEALHFLGEARRFGMKLGLEPMRELARALGSPQEKLRFIHLAGTNGKGSTAAFAESCLRAAGHRVGLYTSPHLVSVRERVQIDRRLISEADFAAGMEAVHEAMSGSADALTFFEIMTGLALWSFARERVDWVVWETGLGGRLDATNIIRSEITIITNIGLDHRQYLGESLEEIAAEKAGIIKPGVPVVSGVEPGPASDVIAARARELKSPLLPRDFAVENLGLREGRQIARIDGREFVLGLMGPHQVQNAGCAVAALRRLPGASISADAFARGLEKTSWSGRFELLSESPLIVLDGAHNAAGVRWLAETWREFLVGRGLPSTAPAHLVFASVTDKDITEMARMLRPLARQVSLVRLDHERSSEPAALAGHFADLPCALYQSVAELWRDLLCVPSELPILVTGSLFLVGEVLAHRQGSAEEYRLNERLALPITR